PQAPVGAAGAHARPARGWGPLLGPFASRPHLPMFSGAAGGRGSPRAGGGAVYPLPPRNPRFHWTGIYELFPDDVLRLGPFIGAPTDHVFIAVGRGVCGSAVAQQRNMNVPDVSKAPEYLACSSATRSELVVLIRKGDTI